MADPLPPCSVEGCENTSDPRFGVHGPTGRRLPACDAHPVCMAIYQDACVCPRVKDPVDEHVGFEIVWSEEEARHLLIEDGVGICQSKSRRQMERIRAALTTPTAWFVAYYNQGTKDDRLVFLPNQRIVREHPLVWFAKALEVGSAVILVSYQPLTAAELACNTQVIDEGVHDEDPEET